ncbi:N5,N10-methylene tetrahydromethanopterin reductase [Cellulomonas hominis]|jgi:alkanesulfonate monooxygenase SsuD/methylene tetrahydromethanopterin reductase-like flavin-dependent oxidoreductase (luciferase family)|uniref:Alkanesulfonate monooxygenase SsuD/methylene tetrahydromethanopterin reductase-like flavin-dependent oxidoreductase (Luciferase family) n=1 Tax=Cellulomonas hominis TaxID=156981 RepID=A0A511FFD7_9CELL|nr:LLM class flavin-dependent oxidoreductase [Cellulomonas hominis]MBB5471272.1 alkanesulfonate monooxygenase SsuD/methylene tetrahydromethanopterin reductase-like flavin-dependent oxidoreductase (luciferase family) [Cellulomonas hominis]GEL47941.1 N5,N10-methylene tetrahydromethanopterin reductase [Cellulomonas hominis]
MAPNPSVGVMLPRDLPAAQVLPFARAAEDLGFDELWVVEDLGFRGGFTQAAAVLGATDRIRVGIGILPAAVRNPVYAAMEIATLEQLFPGRTDVGIGHGMPGWMRQAGCWPERPLTFLTEYVTAVRALLAGEEAAGARLEPAVVPAAVPPLVLGVRGPRSLAASGRIADGTVLAEPTTPEYAAAALDAIAPAGPHRVVAYNVGAVDDDAARALATARPALEWIGEPDWAPHLAPLPYADELAALRARSTSRAEFAAGLPDAWVADLALAGTPDEVRARIAALGRAGVTSSVFIPAGDDPLAALGSLARAR